MLKHCENCGIVHVGAFGSGRFCTSRCAKSYSSKVKREETNKRVSEKLKGRTSPLKGTRSGLTLTEEQREKFFEGIRRYQSTRAKLSEEKKRAANVAKVMAYRARKYAATPQDADLSLIKLIYENCPSGYHVDHIKSLSSGGLHHQNNLQYLPANENCRKCVNREYDKSKAIDWKHVIDFKE